MNLSKDGLVESVFQGLSEGAINYHRWTNGYNITDYGTEHVMNVYIAQSIMDKKYDDRVYVVMEENYDGIRLFSRALGKRGPKPKGLRAKGRVDIAVFRGDEVYSIIETKRSILSPGTYADIERLKHYTDYFGIGRGGEMSFGIFCSLEFFNPEHLDSFEGRMEKKITSIKERVRKLKIENRYKVIKETFNHEGVQKLPVASVMIVEKEF